MRLRRTTRATSSGQLSGAVSGALSVLSNKEEAAAAAFSEVSGEALGPPLPLPLAGMAGAVSGALPGMAGAPSGAPRNSNRTKLPGTLRLVPLFARASSSSVRLTLRELQLRALAMSSLGAWTTPLISASARKAASAFSRRGFTEVSRGGPRGGTLEGAAQVRREVKGACEPLKCGELLALRE